MPFLCAPTKSKRIIFDDSDWTIIALQADPQAHDFSISSFANLVPPPFHKATLPSMTTASTASASHTPTLAAHQQASAMRVDPTEGFTPRFPGGYSSFHPLASNHQHVERITQGVTVLDLEHEREDAPPHSPVMTASETEIDGLRGRTATPTPLSRPSSIPNPFPRSYANSLVSLLPATHIFVDETRTYYPNYPSGPTPPFRHDRDTRTGVIGGLVTWCREWTEQYDGRPSDRYVSEMMDDELGESHHGHFIPDR